MMKLFTVIFLLILSNSLTISAQSGIVNITVISKSTVKPVYEAYVNLYQEGNLLQTELTDLMGRVRFSEVPYGEVELVIDKAGFELYKQIGIINKNTKEFNVQLQVQVDAMSDSYVAPKTKKSWIKPSAHTIKEGNTPMSIASVSVGKTSYDINQPSAGQVTAGEWNDLHKWQDWLGLLENEAYQIMTSRWGISPTQRYSVLVLNTQEKPLSNKSVKLMDNLGQIIWQTYTDNAGKAELWSSVFQKENVGKIIVEYGTGTKEIDTPKPISDGTNILKIPALCQDPLAADIVFTVDATSSMSDEISYLKAELLDVINKVRSKTNDIDLRTGAVFYRDLKDDYITRESQLTNETIKTVDFIKNQFAVGGNDYPEAVDLALEKSVNLNWRPEALKINFLILDAPPHEDEETLDRLKLQIRAAAAKGIKLIPITASGINRETEFLMKFMAILTNGTYLFITDDSGIGLQHLDPVVVDYEVEKLNDIMVRVISQFISIQSCVQPFDNKEALGIKIYPNPCVNFVNINTEEIPSKITITTNSGMEVLRIIPKSISTRIELDELMGGIYTMTAQISGRLLSKRILVVK